MTYLDYIILLERCDQERTLSGNAYKLYLKLLALTNVLGWPEEFEKSDPYVAAVCGFSRNTMKGCRDELESRGLLLTKPGGNGRGSVTTYRFIKVSNSDTLTNKKAANKVSNSDTLISEKVSDSDTILARKVSEKVSNFDTPLLDKEIITSSAADAAGVGEALPEKSEPAPPPANPSKPAGKKTGKVGASTEEIAALPLPHPSPEFAEAWTTFLTGSKQVGKTLNAYQLMLKHLAKKPEGFAIVMLERATVGNWQGVENPGTARAFTEWLAEQAELAARPPAPPAAPLDTTTRDQVFGYTLSAADGLARARQDPAYQRLLAEQQAAVTP